ncbi:MAG: hypothetical protein ACON4E_06505 [Flavobacteriales bacterium]
MKKRTVLNRIEVEDLDKPVELKVITNCPSKWLLIDQETGQVYRGTTRTEVGKMWELVKSTK